jgi:hypothetical protein
MLQESPLLAILLLLTLEPLEGDVWLLGSLRGEQTTWY